MLASVIFTFHVTDNFLIRGPLACNASYLQSYPESVQPQIPFLKVEKKIYNNTQQLYGSYLHDAVGYDI